MNALALGKAKHDHKNGDKSCIHYLQTWVKFLMVSIHYLMLSLTYNLNLQIIIWKIHSVYIEYIIDLYSIYT